jgi:hypothetical protein
MSPSPFRVNLFSNKRDKRRFLDTHSCRLIMQPWYQKAAAKMAREGKTLFQVSNEIDLGLTSKECIDLERDKEFGVCYRGERLKYYKELASDPNRSKESLVGQMFFLADSLMNKDQLDKAATILVNAAKLLGYMDSTQNINIFGNLSQQDLEATRARLKKVAADAIN